MAVIFPEVSLEHLDNDVQMAFDGLDVLAKVVQASLRLIEALGGDLLRGPKLAYLFGETLGDTPDESRQPDQTVRDPVSLRGQLLKICIELRLLTQQELHRPFDLLGRHRLKFHENTLASDW